MLTPIDWHSTTKVETAKVKTPTAPRAYAYENNENFEKNRVELQFYQWRYHGSFGVKLGRQVRF